jgi:hypothetical protein
VYSCREVTKWIASDEYLAAGFFKKLGIRIHLTLCRHCCRYRDQLRALAAAVRKTPGPPPPSEACKTRILDRISKSKP